MAWFFDLPATDKNRTRNHEKFSHHPVPGTIRKLFGRRARCPDAAGVNTSFIPAKTLGTLHNDPLCPHIECYITQLHEQGYTAKTIASHVHLFRHFQRWLKRRRCNLGELNERIVDAFLKDRKHDSHDGAPQVFRRLLGILRASGVTPSAEPPSRTPAQRIADEYRDYNAYRDNGGQWINELHRPFN